MSDATERETVARQLADFVRRQARRHDKRRGMAALGLACHAALPVALDPGLLHLLRLNFFSDSEAALPYEVEADLLLSPLCSTAGDGFYVFPRTVREALLERLVAEYGQERAREVAVLLWQYSRRQRPWQRQPRLERAQELTAWGFIDPAAAGAWLDATKAAPGSGATLDDAWLVAMRSELARMPGVPGETEIEWTPELSALRDVLPTAFPDEDEIAIVLDDAGIDRRGIDLWQSSYGAWHAALTGSIRQKALGPLASVTKAERPHREDLQAIWSALEQTGVVLRHTRLSPSLERDHAALLGRIRDTLARVVRTSDLTIRIARDAALDLSRIKHTPCAS